MLSNIIKGMTTETHADLYSYKEDFELNGRECDIVTEWNTLIKAFKLRYFNSCFMYVCKLDGSVDIDKEMHNN